MFVVSSISVIIQVLHYKRTRKRIFLMAPLHHHFEKKGVHEVRITFCYSLVSLIVGVVVILLNINEMEYLKVQELLMQNIGYTMNAYI